MQYETTVRKKKRKSRTREVSAEKSGTQ